MKTPSQNLPLVREIALSTLIFISLNASASPAAGSGIKDCNDGAKKIDLTCQYAKADAAKKLNAIQAANKAPATPGSNPQTTYQANYLKQAVPALTEESSNCEKAAEQCANVCTLGSGKTEQENTAIKNRKNKCETDAKQVVSDFNKQIASMGGDLGGTEKTKVGNTAQPQQPSSTPEQKSGGGGSPPSPGGGQPPQQSQQQPQQQPQTQPQQQASTPYATDDNKVKKEGEACAGLAGTELTKCQQQSGAATFADSGANSNGTKPSSVGDFCADGKNSSCASCKGMTASTVGSAKGADLQAICSCPNDISLGSKLVEVCKSAFATSNPESIPGGVGAAAAAGGGGGTGGGMGGTPGSQSLIDANKLLNAAELQGSREGQSNLGSLGADGGGFSGYGMGGAVPDEASLGGSGIRPTSAGGRAVTSSGPTSANATDVEKLYGPNVIHIVSDVLKNKCAQGRFMHCGPK
jgi:hypothetical protein